MDFDGNRYLTCYSYPTKRFSFHCRIFFAFLPSPNIYNTAPSTGGFSFAGASNPAPASGGFGAPSPGMSITDNSLSRIAFSLESHLVTFLN